MLHQTGVGKTVSSPELGFWFLWREVEPVERGFAECGNRTNLKKELTGAIFAKKVELDDQRCPRFFSSFCY